MFKNILTYVDMDHIDSWNVSLPKAVELASCCGAKLHVMTSIPDFGMPIVEQFFPADFDDKKIQNEVLKKLKDFTSENVPDNIKTNVIVREGKVRDVILKTSKKIGVDLILLSSARENSRFYVLGATAAHVTRHATCSTLIIR